MYDEENLTALKGSGANTTIELEAIVTSISDPTNSITFNSTYNMINPARLCVASGILGNGTWMFDVQTRYFADGYVKEFFNIQNASLNNNSFPQHIGLFGLTTAKSQEFLISFKDNSFLPVEDALITVTRKYIGESLFRTV